MLWFVGLGISGHRGLSIEAQEVLRNCDQVYFERFTSSIGESDLEGLQKLIGKPVAGAQRWFVEDGREILEQAKSRRIAIVTYGDPLIATTHNELRARAAKAGIETAVLHSASGLSAIIGEAGLHVYKFGRMVTLMADPHSSISAYNTIFENLLSGSHTFVLTEYRQDDSGSYFLSPNQAIEMLLGAEADEKHGVFTKETFAIVASRIGSSSQRIVSGRAGSLAGIDFGPGPHSIIVTGSLHFTESDAVSSLTQVLDPPSDNSAGIVRLSAQMVNRYAPKARAAVEHMRRHLQAEADARMNKGMFEVLDNAEYYISDAVRFLNQSKPELAVLSIGYAEGLVDALRFQKGVNPWLPPG